MIELMIDVWLVMAVIIVPTILIDYIYHFVNWIFTRKTSNQKIARILAKDRAELKDELIRKVNIKR